MSTVKMGFVLLTSAHLVAAAPGFSERLSELCLKKSSNSAEACYCLGNLAEARLGTREQQIILARQEGRDDAAWALMRDLNYTDAIRFASDLKSFSKAVRKDCKIKFRLKPE